MQVKKSSSTVVMLIVVMLIDNAENAIDVIPKFGVLILVFIF